MDWLLFFAFITTVPFFLYRQQYFHPGADAGFAREMQTVFLAEVEFDPGIDILHAIPFAGGFNLEFDLLQRAFQLGQFPSAMPTPLSTTVNLMSASSTFVN